MIIRKVELNNLRELQKIGFNSYVPHYAHLWKPKGIEWYMNRCFGEKFLSTEIVNPNVEYYIIENDDENIGMLKLILKKPLPNSEVENALYLEKIYFVEKWTGKGAGREVMNFVFQRARETGGECIWLVAMDTAEKPVAAYQKSGFNIHSHQFLDFELMKDEFKGTFVMQNCSFNESID